MSVAFSKACLLASAEAWHAPNDTRHAKRKLIIKNMGHGPREFGLWIPRRSTWPELLPGMRALASSFWQDRTFNLALIPQAKDQSTVRYPAQQVQKPMRMQHLSSNCQSEAAVGCCMKFTQSAWSAKVCCYPFNAAMSDFSTHVALATIFTPPCTSPTNSRSSRRFCESSS